MLYLKMIPRCILHYDKIAQISFLTDTIIKASKIRNCETQYVGQFGRREVKNFVLYLLGSGANFTKHDYRAVQNLVFVIFH